MSTQKEKQNSKRHKKNMRRRTLLASQNVLFIDEVNKMLHPIGFDDLPFIEEKLKLMFEPSEKEVA
ncbi:uncharacterized protein METZ01_LOCUS337111 [marine metagenome]|uniref:Uncharacterized protein n=1 Tax=marine metagenome TaxID=408172 RepID=A0A382QGY5_9ZZZZ